MFQYLKAGQKILGMNARNFSYIRPANSRRAIRLANDKLRTKRLMRKAGIPVPKLFGVIKNRLDLDSFAWENLPSSFVLKPNMGLGGGGIMVIYGRKKNSHWIKSSGGEAIIADFKAHIQDILDGRYSISGDPDIAFFEERLKKTKKFRRICYRGTPDVRIIVYNKVPLMAMLRLPTRKSEGKANLHLGGIGAGIDIATGMTTTAIQNDQTLKNIPGTNRAISGVKVPHWKQILRLAIEAQIASSLGYLGADIVLDRHHGPVLLEINARPGLSIQIANLAPLKERLERIRGLKIKTAEKGIRVAEELFGNENEEVRKDEKSGKRIISSTETVTLFTKKGEQYQIQAKIDTGAGYSSISTELAATLGFTEALAAIQKYQFNAPLSPDQAKKMASDIEAQVLREYKDIIDTIIIHSANGTTYRVMVPLTFVLAGIKFKTRASIVRRKHLKYPMIIGRNDLKKFLVDPHKKS